MHTYPKHNRSCKAVLVNALGGVLLIFLIVPLLPPACYGAVFSGRVVDASGNPVHNAVVRIQGTDRQTKADSSGFFSLLGIGETHGAYITAWSPGFYNGGSEISDDKAWYEIRLEAIPVSDNTEYEWLPSLVGQLVVTPSKAAEAKACQECHPAVVEQWQQDAHSRSAVNPLFLSFFYGTDKAGQGGFGPGYKLDFPNSNGNCAACHVPIAALKNPFDTDPEEIEPAAREGINCDFCHKISGAEIDKTGGRPGVLSYQFTRPAGDRQIFYGPLDDVFPGDDSYHPLYKHSNYCAPCHHGRFWAVLAYSEFQEWAESSYAERNIHCQDCHMKPDGVMTHFVEKSKGGISRKPSTLASHVNFGIKDSEFMKESISLETHARIIGDRLHVSAVVRNLGAGHHYPTGNPMRNMILLLEARDNDGKPLVLVEGERLPDWAGVGLVEEGNYAGMPGRGFAKVLKDLLIYPDKAHRRDFAFQYPAPHWRPTLVEYDSRIPADGADASMFFFEIPGKTASPIHVTARLIYRRAYKSWLDGKGFEIDDLELANATLILGR